jgi:hypothetical protein
MTVDLVPSGHWTKAAISTVAKSYQLKELHLTQILPAEYQPLNIIEGAQKQTHLTLVERTQLQNVLLAFQQLF